MGPKTSIVKTQDIVTFGSCFAQHIGKALVQNGFNWLSTEQPPFSLSAENAKKFKYNVFSARTGNIYTTTLLKQWVEWATGAQKVPELSQIIVVMGQSMEMMRALNPELKFLLTVSPVPLTATNSGKHVAVATMSSKSILRAVARQLAGNRGYVDYSQMP